MSKPWARIEVGYLKHPKFLALTGNAIALWSEGKQFCDECQTEGFIPTEALKTFRFRAPRSIHLLCTSIGKRVGGEVYAPLWEATDGGYQMHDYLAYNDTRAAVATRLEDAEDRAELRQIANRDRQREHRAERKAKLEALRHGAVTPLSRPGHAVTGALHEALPEALRTQNPSGPTEALSLSLSEHTREERDARARREPDEGEHPIAVFIRQTYPTVYAKCRNGATFRVSEARDFEVCRDLVDTYGDRVGVLLEYFLQLPPGKDVLNKPGTPRQFKHMAPTCDSELRKHGR